MKNPTLYGLEITLTCPKCQKECPMYGYLPGESDLPDAINKAYVQHQAGDLCNDPTRGTLYLGGKTFTIEEKKP